MPLLTRNGITCNSPWHREYLVSCGVVLLRNACVIASSVNIRVVGATVSKCYSDRKLCKNIVVCKKAAMACRLH